MIGGLFFIPMVSLLGIFIAWYRRDPRRFLDGPAEDAPLRLMRWAIGLLAPQRAEWGQAMLGELGHIEGVIPRMRFALGCVGAALVLPPWGRAAAGVWAMIVLAAITSSLGLFVYTTIAVAVIGGGGPPDADGGFTLRGTISDRIGNNLVLLGFATLVFATIGWGGAAAAGRLLHRTPTATTPATPNSVPPQEA